MLRYVTSGARLLKIADLERRSFEETGLRLLKCLDWNVFATSRASSKKMAYVFARRSVYTTLFELPYNG